MNFNEHQFLRTFILKNKKTQTTYQISLSFVCKTQNEYFFSQLFVIDEFYTWLNHLDSTRVFSHNY